jgi:hypothetical protein
MKLSRAVLIAFRVIRALIGVFALIMLKAALKSALESVSGDKAMLGMFAFRLLFAIAAITTFLSSYPNKPSLPRKRISGRAP